MDEEIVTLTIDGVEVKAKKEQQYYKQQKNLE